MGFLQAGCWLSLRKGGQICSPVGFGTLAGPHLGGPGQSVPLASPEPTDRSPPNDLHIISYWPPVAADSLMIITRMFIYHGQ